MFPITVQANHGVTIMITITLMSWLWLQSWLYYIYIEKSSNLKELVCVYLCVCMRLSAKKPHLTHTHMSKLLGMFEICIKVIVMITNDYNLEYTHF